jgi:hypothetical protein
MRARTAGLIPLERMEGLLGREWPRGVVAAGKAARGVIAGRAAEDEACSSCARSQVARMARGNMYS